MMRISWTNKVTEQVLQRTETERDLIRYFGICEKTIWKLLH